MKFEASIHLTIIGRDWRIDSFQNGQHHTMDLSRINETAQNRITDALLAAINAPGAVKIHEGKAMPQ